MFCRSVEMEGGGGGLILFDKFPPLSLISVFEGTFLGMFAPLTEGCSSTLDE